MTKLSLSLTKHQVWAKINRGMLKRIKRPKRLLSALIGIIGVGAIGLYFMTREGYFEPINLNNPHQLTKGFLAKVLDDAGVFHQFPSELEIQINEQSTKAVVQYSFDQNLQQSMEALMKSYRPDYGALVALDAVTGRVLALVSYSSNPQYDGQNLALRASFPSASVFKVVTAAAAIAEKKMTADTVIPFNGRNHTLYRRQLAKTEYNRWTRYMTLREAFARSVNTVFGKIGAHSVGSEGIRAYAERFGFNRKISSDMPLEAGKANIKENDPWALAEASSGFTRDNTMSPLQGALMAAAVVNDGVMMEPYVIESLHQLDGAKFYSAEPHISQMVMDTHTAREIRLLMRETVSKGTSRGSFKGFARSRYGFIEVGGKTGSLTGMDPRGKYDWFVGFGESGNHRIAIAALTVHRTLWRVKSSYLARRAIEQYYSDRIKEGAPDVGSPVLTTGATRGFRKVANFGKR